MVPAKIIDRIGQKSIKKRDKSQRKNLLGKKAHDFQNEFLQEYPTNIIEYEQEPTSDDNQNGINL